MYIKIVKTAKEKFDALRVRRIVFIEEQKVPEDLEIDGFEEEATHFVGYLKKQPVAAGRVRFVDQKGKLERICVLKEHRGKSYGKKLIQEMEQFIKEKNISETILSSQVHAILFYEKLGYRVVSKQYMDAGIPHVTMKKQL